MYCVVKEAPATDHPPSTDAQTLAKLERCAVRLARAAGERILAAAASRAFTVQFKEPRPGSAPNSNLVTDVDRDVEAFIRAELAAAYPDHAVIGEEIEAAARRGAEFTWVIDPIDGTMNFVNGVPLFASSIGVLCQGWPIAGAIWCASTHALCPGIYHARSGGVLCFDGVPLERRGAGAWRRVAAQPGSAPELGKHWELRVLGSATLEFAFTAAGLLELAYIRHPCLWDAAAGLALIQAAGCAALTSRGEDWMPLVQFAGDLSHWCQPVLIGSEHALRAAAPLAPSRF
jgi:myo-inositol-1(or 4)-monophosphatase